ncbi:MAG: hypothetical protein JO345_27130 [Streptosporangiaceae bacterium]|nr:hypothetical protein [Streptosporangiaceae bacterium]
MRPASARRRIAGVLAAVTSGLIMAAGAGLAAAQPPLAARSHHTAADGTGPAASPAHIAAGDEVVTGTGDTGGYHIYAASAGGGSSWIPLATLQPGGYSDERWTGRQCLTGDGRSVIAVVAPWHASNSAAGMDTGGYAYLVDAHDGRVRPLTAGVSLAYFNPGCGASGQAVLTRYTRADEGATQLLTVDTRTATVRAAAPVAGELTSAVPVPGGIVAVRGDSLVSGSTSRPAQRLLATLPGAPFDLRPAADGAVEALVKENSRTAGLWRVSAAGAAQRLGSGPLTGAQLFAGRGAPGRVLASTVPFPGPLVTRSSPAYVGGRMAAATAQTPKCAVPRLSTALQVPQPDAAQVDWAAQQAARGMLTANRPDSRWGLTASAPSSDFPLPAPFGSATPVPREVVEAVMAQESNWWQASWHALPGIAGDPLVADYYGYNSSGTINYSQADCGYGMGQITSIMTAGATDPFTGASVPQPLQDKVAMDYAENAAATAYYLAHLWNQVTTAGLKINDGNPEELENWYFTIWAYNTGLHPGTGSGPWGLGWLNNPINPVYPPNRPPFLQDTYADASHPADWPYQERVFGWMRVPLGGDTPDYAPAVAYPKLPAESAFCSLSVDNCDPADSANGFCELSNSECWWHAPVTYVSSCTSADCTPTSFQVATTASEPAPPADPHPPVCNSTLPANAIIVDDEASDANQQGCGNTNWHNSGTFTIAYGTDGAGEPVGAVDWHQLGAGFGGHFWFTHTRQAGELTADTGTWTPSGLTSGGVYNVKVFVPDTGAAAAQATYTISPGNGHPSVQRTIDQFAASDVWVGLGDFTLYPGATLTLSSVAADANGNDDTDIAFNAAAFVPVSGTLVHHTVDTVTTFAVNQNLDSGLECCISAKLASGQVLNQWASQETLGAAQLPACSAGVLTTSCLPPTVSAAFAAWARTLSEPAAQWIGFANPALPNPLTSGWLDDPTHYKTLTHLDADYLVRPDGTIDPGSIDVTGYNRIGTTALAPFILPLMNAIATDYGIPVPDLTYSGANLGSYNDVTTTVNLSVTGQAPGRSYMPWIDPPALDSSRTCLSLAAITGGADGYVPILNDSGIGSQVQGWSNAVDSLYQQGLVPAVVRDTVKTIVTEFFKPIDKNPLDQWAAFTSAPQAPFDLGGSMLTFAPTIWAETHLELCTGTTLVEPDGNADPSGVQTTADNSYMPDLYLYVDGNLRDASGNLATGPISTGDWKTFSAPPWDGAKSPISQNSPWNGCYIDNAPVFISRRDGNPFALSLLTAPGELGNSVYRCDAPQEGIHYDTAQP